VAQVVEHLPSKSEALSSNPNTIKKKANISNAGKDIKKKITVIYFFEN
jgi:hypothetical protein